MSRVTLTLSAAFITALSLSPAKAVEVYLFKGAGDFSFINKNMHFSRGLDRIAEKLNSEGIRAEVRGFAQAGEALAAIKRRKPESVAFVGHSMGALASMSMARKMRSLGIRVAYVGTLDIPGPVGTAGRNVEWAENYWSITPIYGLLTNASSHPKAKNIHVLGTHTTMDDSRKVFNGVVSAIRQIHAAEGGATEPAIADTPETIMVDSKPSSPDRQQVQVASVSPVTSAPDTQSLKQAPAPRQVTSQQFAMVKQEPADNFADRIRFAHSEEPKVGKPLVDQTQTGAIPADMMPVNLLATPIPSQRAESFPQNHAALVQPQVQKLPASQQPGYIAPADGVETGSGQVYREGRITSVGRRIVSRISGMLSRNGKRHDRRARQEEVESQR